MNSQKIIFIVLIGIVVGGAAWFFLGDKFQSSSSDREQITPTKIVQTSETTEETGEVHTQPMYKGELTDVTTGDLRGINTEGNATGDASFSYTEGEFSLTTTMTNLPEPLNGDFYEGWLVRQDPFKFISTGKAIESDEIYFNRFTSETDYSEYTQYVLTLEPDDGDPAPADHILEGTLSLTNDM